MSPCDARIQGVLLGNAAFSLGSGITCLAAGGVLAALLHPALPAWTVQVTGLGLALFAVRLIMMGQGDHLDHRQICLVILADLAWVAGSVFALAVWGGQMSASGIALVSLAALVVSLFAVVQTGGVLKARAQEARTA